jgi:hypothetical protein
MYIDPQLGGLLLEPLFRLQASPSYKAPYPVTDLGAFPNRRLEALIIERSKGSNYPNVTIGNSHHNQRVERSYLSCSSRVSSLLILLNLFRIGKYVDHDICPRSCQWRWWPDKQIRTYEAPIGYLWRANKSGQYSQLTSWANYLSNSTLYTADECVVLSLIHFAESLNNINSDHLLMDCRAAIRQTSPSRELSLSQPCQR